LGRKRETRKSLLFTNTGVLYDTVRYYAILAETNIILCQQSSDSDMIGCEVSRSIRRDLNPGVGARC